MSEEEKIIVYSDLDKVKNNFLYRLKKNKECYKKLFLYGQCILVNKKEEK